METKGLQTFWVIEHFEDFVEHKLNILFLFYCAYPDTSNSL